MRILALPLIATAAMAQAPSPEYRTEQARWRADYETRIKAERGWLAVAGLYWLNEGETTIGTDPSSGVVLPEGTAPGRVGVLTRSGDKVSLKVEDGVEVKIGDQPVTSVDLKSDATGAPDRVKVRDLTFSIIQRGKRVGIRLWDPNSKGRRTFEGVKWFPLNSKYRVVARYVPYAKPKKMAITNVIGDTQDVPNPGYAEFTLEGKKYRLEAEDQGETFFFNFQDGTTAKQTYPAGRFLDADKPKDGVIVLDFNQATNPPCAFTAFATCPLAPAANRLRVPIRAGELTHHVPE